MPSLYQDGLLLGCPGRVIVYRDGSQRVSTGRELARVGAITDPLTRLIDVGELEAAVVDAEFPERDGITPRSTMFRRATLAAAQTWLGLPAAPAAIDPTGLPETVSLRVSEGYAYYSLDPRSYAAAARRLHDETAVPRCSVIGIRSIGTSLSAVVAAVLAERGCETRTHTVRPRGHPFDRRLALDESLISAWRRDAVDGAFFAVVDEGPGISGSSFAAVVTALDSLGIPTERIVIFPSWDPDPSALRSPVAREVWRRVRRYRHEERRTDESLVDFSAGGWRRHVYAEEQEWPACHPQHERVKLFDPDMRRLFKFVGFGRYGEEARLRAEALAALGLGASPGPLAHGLLDQPWIEGRPIRIVESSGDARYIGEYIGRIARAFTGTDASDARPLLDMIAHNLRLDVGGEVAIPHAVPAVAIDGRMLAHEWLRTIDGSLRKVDALDHYRDHFYPGPQSPAWDLAAAAIEMHMDAAIVDEMLTSYERASGDRAARRWIPFYTLAWLAFRFGYAALAADTLRGTPEANRFEREAARYSQCALNATACRTAASKSPRKQIARSSMNT